MHRPCPSEPSHRPFSEALRCLLRHLEPKDLALSAAAAGAAKRAQKGEEGAVDGVAETEVKLVAALKAATSLGSAESRRPRSGLRSLEAATERFQAVTLSSVLTRCW